MNNEFSVLFPCMATLDGCNDVPSDFSPEYKIEEICPCGCDRYVPDTVKIAQDWEPIRINACQDCGRAQLMVSINE